MILSPQDENTKAFETDESASTPPTSRHHIILSFETNKFPYSMVVYFNTILHDLSAMAGITEFDTYTNLHHHHIQRNGNNGQLLISGMSVEEISVAEIKGSWNNTSKNNPETNNRPEQGQTTGKDYAEGHGEKKYYGGVQDCVLNATIYHDGHVLQMLSVANNSGPSGT
ncbi:hypothetical protein Tco_0006322 [Tanacetum coccineum]